MEVAILKGITVPKSEQNGHIKNKTKQNPTWIGSFVTGEKLNENLINIFHPTTRWLCLIEDFGL